MKYFLIAILTAILVQSCNIINPKEPVPTYINIDTFTFKNPNASFTGTSSQLIPAAFVYADGQAVGAFDLPCTVPALIKQDAKITIIPAVYNQGLRSYIIIYPFFNSDTSHTLKYKPGEIQSIKPITGYRPTLTESNFKYKNDFESGLNFKYLSGDGEMKIENNPSIVFEGKNVGAIILNNEIRTIEVVATDFITPQIDKCFLEINYRCSVPFAVGMRCENDNGGFYEEYLAGFNSRTTWNKMYVELGSFMHKQSLYSKFYLTFRASLDGNLDSASEGYVYIDNIKIVAL
jgi:hypothetical protein